jgi:hypothetical protein
VGIGAAAAVGIGAATSTQASQRRIVNRSA